MKKQTTAVVVTTGALASLGLTALAPVSASAQGSAGTTSLAEVLAAGGLELDSNWRDFDVVDQAVNDVIADESVLLYHVVPGATITYRAARQADGARLATANGAKVRVDHKRRLDLVFLVDRDRDDRNAFVLPAARNLNKGNRQIAHGVPYVLRPIDL